MLCSQYNSWDSVEQLFCASSEVPGTLRDHIRGWSVLTLVREASTIMIIISSHTCSILLNQVLYQHYYYSIQIWTNAYLKSFTIWEYWWKYLWGALVICNQDLFIWYLEGMSFFYSFADSEFISFLVTDPHLLNPHQNEVYTNANLFVCDVNYSFPKSRIASLSKMKLSQLFSW